MQKTVQRYTEEEVALQKIQDNEREKKVNFMINKEILTKKKTELNEKYRKRKAEKRRKKKGLLPVLF